ncbi:fatty acid desaturase [Neorhizobium galegae]|uniref:fatty acid desaturase family protein n=1 Tax=Neorhizobium galegae TaxID=399 RepID=UPI0027844063|nr:fatty acid desaturase family protein [Neorhizobium galegae]MDQ0138072.1 fatty acid desaturase [Neorhizobium galegae]
MARIRDFKRDYSLVGRDTQAAVEEGITAAEWYQTEIPRAKLKELMKRSDGPAIRDTVIWFAILGALAGLAYWTWGSWWCVPVLAAYGVYYGSASDARWHETGHGTAFKTRWMNNAVYTISCFMMLREPRIWRWSHARHHTDTIIVGRDPEIGTMRPADLARMAMAVFGVRRTPLFFKNLVKHAFGKLTAEEEAFVPEMERQSVYRTARVLLLIHVAILAAAVYLQSWLIVLLVGPLPSMYGGWLSYYLAITQHAGLEENVLDHRLCARTIYVNPILRFIYWNMNYHVEHHMYPMVPYHRLPELHKLTLHDMPRPYRSTFEAFAEIIPAIRRQRREPDWYIVRELPPHAEPPRSQPIAAGAAAVPAE